MARSLCINPPGVKRGATARPRAPRRGVTWTRDDLEPLGVGARGPIDGNSEAVFTGSLGRVSLQRGRMKIAPMLVLMQDKGARPTGIAGWFVRTRNTAHCRYRPGGSRSEAAPARGKPRGPRDESRRLTVGGGARAAAAARRASRRRVARRCHSPPAARHAALAEDSELVVRVAHRRRVRARDLQRAVLVPPGEHEVGLADLEVVPAPHLPVLRQDRDMRPDLSAPYPTDREPTVLAFGAAPGGAHGALEHGVVLGDRRGVERLQKLAVARLGRSRCQPQAREHCQDRGGSHHARVPEFPAARDRAQRTSSLAPTVRP